MRALLVVILLLIAAPAFSASVQFGDGRVCNNCSVQSQGGYVSSVKDSQGNEWVHPGDTGSIYVVKHPFLQSFSRAAVVGGQQYARGAQQSHPITTNCSSYGPYGYRMTNCSSY